MTSHVLAGSLQLGPADAPHRVLLLHYAGGSPASLLPLTRLLTDSCAVGLLEVNNRQVPANTFTEAVARLSPHIESLVDRPTTVFGHSMGALLAHALVMRLPAERRSLLRSVVLSGSRSPATTRQLATRRQTPSTVRSREELIRDLDRYGGCPPQVFTDPPLLDLAVTALGQDMRLVDTYSPAPLAGTDHRQDAGTTYHIWYGDDDEEATSDEARRWASDLPRPPRLRSFPGGHFYLTERQEAAARALRHLVTTGDGSP